jgi:hypothetical protein
MPVNSAPETPKLNLPNLIFPNNNPVTTVMNIRIKGLEIHSIKSKR